MIMKSEKFKNIFEGLKIAYGQYQKGDVAANGDKQKGKAFIVRQNVSDDLWEKHLQGEMICGRSIYREKVRLLELSLLQRIIRVGGVVLISTNIILITASSFKAYEILISP
jgi:hypothetical protein